MRQITDSRRAANLKPYLNLLVYLLLAIAPAVVWNGAFPLDDAYITMSNARVLLTGTDPYYATSALTGATSGVHLALLALLGLLMPIPVALMAISVASAFAYLWGLDVLVRKVGASRWKVPVLVLTGYTVGTVPHLLMNGLETGMAMAAVTWLLVLADDRRLAYLAGISVYVRPELGVLAALLMLRQIWHLPRGEAIKRVAIAALAASPWAIWYVVELGTPLPNTMAAKAAFFNHELWRIEFRIALFLMALIEFRFLPIFLGFLGLPRVRGGWAALGFVLIFLAVALTEMPGALNWNFGRYMAVLVPPMVLGLARLSGERGGSALLVVVSVVCASGLPGNWESLQKVRSDFAAEEIATRRVLAQLPVGSILLVHDAGLPAWVQPKARLVDVVGLKTPSSIMSHKQWTRDMCHWGKAEDEIARRAHASHFLVLKMYFWECLSKNLRDEGWKLKPMVSGTSEYQLFELTAPTPSARLDTAKPTHPASNSSVGAENDARTTLP